MMSGCPELEIETWAPAIWKKVAIWRPLADVAGWQVRLQGRLAANA